MSYREFKDGWESEIREIPTQFKDQAKDKLESALKETKIYFSETQSKNKRIIDNAYKILALVNALAIAEIGFLISKGGNSTLLVLCGFVLLSIQFSALIFHIFPVIKPSGSFQDGTPPDLLMTNNLISCSWEELFIHQGKDYYERIRFEYIRNQILSEHLEKAIKKLVLAPIIAFSIPASIFLYRGLSLGVDYCLKSGISLF